MPQLSAIWFAAKRGRELGIPIIADGGITYSGDIVKAMVAGASTVMLGSLLAGTEESPGEMELLDGRKINTLRSSEDGSVIVRAGTVFNEKVVEKLDFSLLQSEDGWCDSPAINQKIERLIEFGMSDQQIDDGLETLLAIYAAEGITPKPQHLVEGLMQLHRDAA